MRLRLVALFAALAVGCATTPSTPPPPPPPPPLSPEAAAVFARAEAPGPGGALVVNLDAFEDLGLAGKGPTMDQLAGMASTVMAQLSVGEGSEARLFARGSVAGALLRQWAKWPGVRRIAFIVPTDRALRQGPEVLPNEVVGALAVDEGSPENPELLAGVASILRAVAQELGREGAEVRMALRGQDLCVEGSELGTPVCIRPKRGLLLFGTPTALTAFEALPPPTAPAATPGEAPLLVGLRVDLGAKGRGRLAFTGRDAVRLSLNVQGAAPKDIGMLDAIVKKSITDYDTHQAEVRQRVAAGLAEVQKAVAADATAPASLKQATSALTAERVVDEKGYWTQTRQSLQVSSTQDSFSLAFTVPEGSVKELADQLSGGGTPVAMMGILSAIAIPNFIKFQGRAKQSEVRANLKAAFTSQRVYFQEKDRWGRSFEEIGFSPEKGRLYTYCMGKQCLPCDKQGCQVAPPPHPCQGLTSVGQGAKDGFSVCAYANMDSDDTWDVWVIDQDGEPEQLSNDLE
ncbi:type IV pilin protein [Hyalangium rubrum]|uniref:type IV pilin protein n=1 Tax=Hyalangium rubrum TaxID=3103134 RepID=UPI003BF45E8F